jgi:hypothetical protein
MFEPYQSPRIALHEPPRGLSRTSGAPPDGGPSPFTVRTIDELLEAIGIKRFPDPWRITA